jgi:hypothetical protein
MVGLQTLGGTPWYVVSMSYSWNLKEIKNEGDNLERSHAISFVIYAKHNIYAGIITWNIDQG